MIFIVDLNRDLNRFKSFDLNRANPVRNYGIEKCHIKHLPLGIYSLCMYCYMDSLPLPYFTQTAYPDNRHSRDCMLYCVGRLTFVPPNSLRCDCVIHPCARVSLLFYSRVPKTLEHSRSLKFTVRVMSRI